MIYAEITTILQPGKMEVFYQIEKDMHPRVEKSGFKLIGAWHTTIGNYNEISTLYSIEDMDHFEKTGTFLSHDKEYMDLAQKLASITVSRIIKVMRPNPSSPMK